MARGHPDWGQATPTETISLVADLGELAVRLGALSVYDRGGNVVWADGFEFGLSPWLPQTDGTGALVEIVSEPTYSGESACKLTGGSDGWARAGVLKRIRPPVLGRFGAELTFSIATPNDNVEIRIQHNDGVNRRRYFIKLIESTDELQYLDADGNYQKFAEYILANDDAYLFHTCKAFVDLENHEYVKFMINQQSYDLSGIACETVADTTNPRLEVTIYVTSRAGSNDVIYVDNVIITMNEP